MRPQEHTVERYSAAVLALVQPLDAEQVPLTGAVGRVTHGAITARHAVPRFDHAAMDGYAVRAANLAGSTRAQPTRLVVVGHAPAGPRRHPLVVGPGQAVRIMTGAPIPDGADMVVPVECSVTGHFVKEPTVALWAAAQANIRRVGEDVAAGDPLLATGSVLTARALGLLATTGHTDVRVYRRPRVAIVSSGDELDDGSGSKPGVVPDSNAVYLHAAVESLGGIVTSVHRAKDDMRSLVRVLDVAARKADLIVTSGGLGPGTHDLLGHVAAASAHGMLARVAMRPGRPQAHGTWNGVPWLAVPGTPTAAFVSFEAFVRPVLARLAGRDPDAVPATAETVSEGWPGTPGTVRYVPLAVVDRPDGVTVAPMGSPNRAPHQVSAMFVAPLIGVVGADVDQVLPGKLLRVIEPT